MKKNPDTLTKIRKKIDALDKEIVHLINQRGQCALEVAKIKRQDNNDSIQGNKNPIYYRPEREAQIFQQLQKNNSGPLSNRDLLNIFRPILSACRALQQPLIITTLVKNTLSERAAQLHFGSAIKIHPATSTAKLFQQVLTHQSHYGVVPIEHSRKGIVPSTLDTFLEYPSQICGEIQILETNQQDNMRFLIIGDHPTAPSGNDKTSLLISTAHQPGSLARFFQPFAQHQVNITAIATHPLHNELWRYVFFLEIEGHQQDDAVKKALAELDELSLTYRVLGSYPRSIA
jgi:chorismate mutase-like protein